MKDKIFIDTNLWIYLFTKEPKEKFQIISEYITNYYDSIIISSQILGEVYNVLTKKFLTEKAVAQNILINLSSNFKIAVVDKNKCLKAVEINIDGNFGYWDSLIVATALFEGCKTVLTEDMHNNQLIDGKLILKNPFIK